MMSKLQRLFVFIPTWVVGLWYVALVPVYAAGLVPCDGIKCTLADLTGLVTNIYNLLLSMAGLVALLVIIWGGIKMIISYIGIFDSPDKDLESGKQYVRGGIIGLIVIACSYLIVNTVIIILGGGTIDQFLKIF